MAKPVNTLELAQRLRRNAEETNLPDYADLMRRAAADLEAFVRPKDPACVQLERKAG